MVNELKFILASNSPRRREILKRNGYIFDIIPSKYDEKFSTLNYSKEKIEKCAYFKALDVQKSTKTPELIVSADTVVVLDDVILGKPKNRLEAIEMLNKLSNKTHFVATSICLLKNDVILKGTQTTFVTFRKLSDYDIENYIDLKNPLDKAGSYGIQDEGFDFAIKVDRDMDNVVGFPIRLFKNLLSDMHKHF